MIEQSFVLVPFPAAAIPSILLTGKFSLVENELKVHYSLSGNIRSIMFPPIVQTPTRKDELWKGTCFELFLAINDQPGYWEFNMSPSGDWNIYRMDSYRRVGFREEKAFSNLPFVYQKGTEIVLVDVSVDLTPILREPGELEIGITAILQTQDGSETYWALNHPAAHADFHMRESFIPVRAGQTRPLG